MLPARTQTIGPDGHLMIEGCDTVQLAEEYGTPLYVMSETELRTNIQSILAAIHTEFGNKGYAAYASKALSCKEIVRIVNDEGMRLDVVSSGELFTALSAGFPAERIYFHGNNKSLDELKYAVTSGVGQIVVDNLFELSLLTDIVENNPKPQKILLRARPGVEPHTHSYVVTGGIDSKYGMSIENGELDEAVRIITGCKGLELVGVHCHIGSQILEHEPFQLAAGIMADLFCSLQQRFSLSLQELNLGGGFGVPYTDEELTSPDPQSTIASLANAVKKAFSKRNVELPDIILEPGRSVVATAGTTLYTVGSIKAIPGIRTYLAVDGGMTDNPRYALYRSSYFALVANKANLPKDSIVTIAGKCCESGDLLQEHIAIQQAEPGDILAVMPTGAYNYSMASNYNRILRPAMVMVNGDQSRVIIKRETLEKLVENDI